MSSSGQRSPKMCTFSKIKKVRLLFFRSKRKRDCGDIWQHSLRYRTEPRITWVRKESRVSWYLLHLWLWIRVWCEGALCLRNEAREIYRRALSFVFEKRLQEQRHSVLLRWKTNQQSKKKHFVRVCVYVCVYIKEERQHNFVDCVCFFCN